ncbi:carboxypeptidase regulatory-like domain-containing protein [Candidatus Palauibacter sp.]|uniref:carboxypeptidase-like regulatory domain-containing protein n=1 Tax=Candidatus Palauibacter sp. TaxID=3101350 RepID=UPI003B026690
MTQRSALVRAALTASLGLALLALPLVAQEGGARLSGFLLTEGSGAPVEGAHVILVDPGEVVLGEALSDGRGAFSLPMPAPGVYRLRITRIGYEPWASDTLHIDSPPASRVLRFHVPVQPIPLPELSVTEQNVCPTTPEERRRAFALYESVHPILTKVSATSDLGTLQMRMIRPIVVWRRGAHRYQQDTATVVARKSLDNASPDHLERYGYAEAVNDSLTTFYAPDGDALASPGFLATHCLRPVESRDDGTVGLGFEPKPGRTPVDIRGVLWIDTVAGGPRELEFQYTSLRPFLRRHLEPALRVHFMSRDPRTRFHPIEMDEADFGGVLRFERINRDRWLIREWSIRRPVLTQKYLWRVNHGTTVWPRAYPLTTSAEVLALIRPPASSSRSRERVR